MSIYETTGIINKRYKNIKTNMTDFNYLLQVKPQVERGEIAEVKKSKAKYFLSGELLDNTRKDENMINKSLLVLDYDNISISVEEFKKAIHDKLSDYNYFLYPTISHTVENPRYRLILEPTRAFVASESKRLISRLTSLIGLPCDKASETYSQHMGLPIIVNGSLEQYEKEIVVNQGKPYPIDALLQVVEIEETNSDRGTFTELQKLDYIPYRQSFATMQHFIERNKEALQDSYSSFFISCKVQLAKSVTEGEIKLEEAITFIKMLALGNKNWETDNVTRLKQELKTKHFKISSTFMQKFSKEYAKELDIEETNEQWFIDLRRAKDGTIKNDLTNIAAILLNDSNLKGLLAFDEFSQKVVKKGKTFWKSYNTDWTDNDVSMLRNYLDNKYEIRISKDNLHDSTLAVSKNNSFHPVKDFITNTEWDGVERIEQLFIDFLGADDNDYVRAVTKKWITGAVARIYRPGIKFEIVPVITGKQGLGKSTFISKLGNEWYTDGLSGLGNNKDDLQFLLGSWIIELGELSATRRTEVEQTKQFISATKDRYRPSYGRITAEYPRTCVFIGTSNDNTYLKDKTGNRRFFPIPVITERRLKDPFKELEKEVPQIWAEAYEYFYQGEELYLSQELEKIADSYREEAEEVDEVEERIKRYLEIPITQNWYELSLETRQARVREVLEDHIQHYQDTPLQLREKVTASEILTELFGRSNRDELRGNAEAKKINLVMSKLTDWERKKVSINGHQSWGYKRVLQN
ncbi:VapE domain-containing protein [Desemzia incerta]|uniref:VapE domain-containing protein n=1 Tax=Desemzia incerta TaxID=82801 RepID=UPI003CFED160